VNRQSKEVPKKLLKYKPVQMELFQIPIDAKKYSNSIELYDAIPKYLWGKALVKNEKGKYVPRTTPLERPFKFKNCEYMVVVQPAQIKKGNGEYKHCYPGEREEIMEDALRKLACSGQGYFLDDQAGVVFTLNELRKELERVGHSLATREIKEALMVCNQTHIKLTSLDGKDIVGSSLFETLGLSSREEWEETGGKTRCFVRFNQLVTRSIRAKTFRQLNYEECMSYSRALSRYLHKRISHAYTQAGALNTYDIHLLTVIRDSGMKRYAKLSDNLRKVKEALDEMKEKEVVQSYEIHKIIYGRKLVDAEIKIKTSYSFNRDMKRANAISLETRKKKNHRLEV
jgi:hypothetical protein